jgi:hypothetical protein
MKLVIKKSLIKLRKNRTEEKIKEIIRSGKDESDTNKVEI